MTNIFFI